MIDERAPMRVLAAVEVAFVFAERVEACVVSFYDDDGLDVDGGREVLGLGERAVRFADGGDFYSFASVVLDCSDAVSVIDDAARKFVSLLLFHPGFQSFVDHVFNVVDSLLGWRDHSYREARYIPLGQPCRCFGVA